MIIKNYEIEKIALKKNPFILIYGKNEGYKNQIINNLTKNKNYASYDEKEILENTQNFLKTYIQNHFLKMKK